MGGQVAHITREIINIDRDYEDDMTHFPELRYDIILHDNGEAVTDDHVLAFHKDIDEFIRNYRFEKDGD